MLDDSLKSGGGAVDSSGVILPVANDPGSGSSNKSERAGSNAKDSELMTTQEQSQKLKSEISGSRTAGIEDNGDPDSGRNQTGAIAVESSNAVSVVSESECSDSLSGNSFPPGSSYLKSLESMKADSAYSSASCSSSDSDNCDKR